MRWGALIIALLFPSLCFAAPKLDPKTCDVLTAHTADASVAYTAGVDASGNKVVPADLNAPQSRAPDEIKLPLTIDLMHYLGTKADTAPFNQLGQHEATLGVLTIKGNEVFLNDKKLNKAQQDELSALCEHN